MAELDHRVKNILGNVSAIARLSSHRATSVDAFVEALDGRIQAISRAHTPAAARRVGRRQSGRAGLRSAVAVPLQRSNIEIEGEPGLASCRSWRSRWR